MKKTVVLILLTIITFTSCEKDDFCIQNPITPLLVLRFYDNTNRDNLKNVERLSIWAAGKDTLTTYTSVSLDSVAIPLNSLTTETVYHFKMNNLTGNINDNTVDTFTIQYTTEEKYVSRSCGFKVIFNQASFSSSNVWIQDFTPTTATTIDHQNTAHVKIYH